MMLLSPFPGRAPMALPCIALAIAGILSCTRAFGDPAHAEIDEMKRQIRGLQEKIERMESRAAEPAAMPATTAAPATAKPSGKYDGIAAGPLNIRFGGFIELAGLYRSHDELTDVGSSFGGIPFASSPGSHLDEFRASARQSRLSLLIAGPADDGRHAEAYYEMDFLGAAQTANSRQSNSYNLRIRNIYAQYANDHSGFAILAGQSWSLVTQGRKGIVARSELVPMTIDAQYVPGFAWTRNAQIRFTEKFSEAVSAGFSLESPQTLFGGKAPPGVIGTITGSGQFNNANSYSLDSAPDVVVKLAFDPGWGHYELFGVNRWFRVRTLGSGAMPGHNDSRSAVSGGASVLLPLLARTLEFQASAMIGKGLGRYGSVQLPDATYDAQGGVRPIRGSTWLAGLMAHPHPALDLYAYVGGEKVDATYSAVLDGAGAIEGYVGYGSPAIDLSGCAFEGGACAPNNGKATQGTIGAWWKVYRGSLGYLQVGVQGSYTRLQALPGQNGQRPDTHMSVGMVALRYHPYQN